MIYGENTKLSIAEIMGGLSAESQWMMLVRNEEKAYTKLIDHLLSEWSSSRETNQGKRQINTVKHYADSLGEKPATVNKWLRQIYQDIFDLNETQPELFLNAGESMCSFEYSPSGLEGGFWFNLGVRSIPRVGDIFSFRFVKAVAHYTDFVVNEVTHRYEKGQMGTEVFLRTQYYEGESYRRLLIDKARFLGYMDILETFGSDYSIDKKLKSIFGKMEDYI